jgi:radical SAM superfamily enzyme YgiQ (UPF0313 family)
MTESGKKGWRDVSFEDIFPNRKKKRIIGMTFPETMPKSLTCGLFSSLEPSVLSVLPEGDNVEYSQYNIDFDDEDVLIYVCSVYITGYDEFVRWAGRHNIDKIIVGGYHPTTFPEEFVRYARKVIQGPCDDIFATIDQVGQVVNGISTFKKITRYDLYRPDWNQQIIPDKKLRDRVVSLWTSQGCPFNCEFCCTPIMSPKLLQKPTELVIKEVEFLKGHCPDYLFIRDENFTLQKDWRERLKIISEIGAKIYLFASANTLSKESIGFMKDNGVYMICLGLEEVNKDYKKNSNIDQVMRWMKERGIYTYLSFIINPLDVVGKEEGKIYYERLMARIYELAPEMICGNFLMPFRGTKIWDKYYAFVSRDDYRNYDSKTPLMIRNEVVKEKMKFFMFWYQWLYYTSEFYNTEVRKFDVGDTLHLKLEDLYKEFRPKYERMWNIRP